MEKPNSLPMKFAYYFNRKQFGKVITPLRVQGTRLPPAVGMHYAKIEQLDKKLHFSLETILLIRHQVARLNNCLFSMDQQRWGLIKWSVNAESKFDALKDYATSPLFSDAERALLNYVTELTKEKKVKPETFARLAKHYSEQEICEVVWIIGSEHLLNFSALGLNIQSDGLVDLIQKQK